jgi:hypothetical protein
MEKLNLPPNTAALWSRLQDETLLENSYLIGGTAIALLIQHRISEDLDFFFKGVKLPTGKIDGVIGSLKIEGYAVQRNDNLISFIEFKEKGDSLHNYQQNFIINDTKVTFFVNNAYTPALLTTPVQNKPVIPSLRELFETKALAVGLRDKSRDWIDMYVLMKDHNFTVSDFKEAYRKIGQEGIAEKIFDKLTRITGLNVGGEDYAHLMKQAPSIDEMQDYFAGQKAKLFQTPQQKVNGITRRAISRAADDPPAQGRGMKL